MSKYIILFFLAWLPVVVRVAWLPVGLLLAGGLAVMWLKRSDLFWWAVLAGGLQSIFSPAVFGSTLVSLLLTLYITDRIYHPRYSDSWLILVWLAPFVVLFYQAIFNLGNWIYFHIFRGLSYDLLGFFDVSLLYTALTVGLGLILAYWLVFRKRVNQRKLAL